MKRLMLEKGRWTCGGTHDFPDACQLTVERSDGEGGRSDQAVSKLNESPEINALISF